MILPPETIPEFMLRLKQAGISVTLREGNLGVVCPPGRMSPALLAELKHRKPELVQFLAQAAARRPDEIIATGKQASYETSPSQQRIWLFEQLDQSKQTHNVPGAYQLRGRLEPSAMQAALQALIARHEILRTTFHLLDGAIRQVVHDPFVYPVEAVPLPAEGRREVVERLVGRNLAHRFDLSRLPLLNFQMVQLDEAVTLVLFNLHHIVCDGHSLGLLYRELLALYRLHTGAAVAAPAPLRIQYRDYAAWLNGHLASPDLREQQRYWHAKLANRAAPLELPWDSPRSPRLNHRGSAKAFCIPPGSAGRLRRLAVSENCSLFNALLAFVNVLLYRLCGSPDICVGTPVLGRPHAELADQIGCYINLIVLRNEVRGTASCRALMQAVQRNTAEAWSHQLYPFDRLVHDLGASGQLNRNPLFDVMVTLEENEHAPLEVEGFSGAPHPVAASVSHYELTFGFTATGEALRLNLEYMSGLFAADTVDKIGACFLELLESGLDDPDGTVDELNLLPLADREQLSRFNATHSAGPGVESILPLLEAQRDAAPDAPACVLDGRVVTRAALHERADRLAAALVRQYAVQPEEVVGIVADRDDAMVAGLLGILKAGAAYLPIHPDHPENRIRALVEASRCRHVVVGEGLRQKVHGLAVTLVGLDTLWPDAEGFRPAPLSPGRLAYVLHTSGSTGQPKGVMVEHGSLLNTLAWFGGAGRIGRDSRVLLMSEFTFDVSVEEIFGTLLAGATLYIPPREVVFNKHLFRSYIKRHGISVAQFVPATLRQLLAGEAKLSSLDTVICGGEALPEDLKDQILAAGYRLFNHYGPTECTVDALAWECRPFVPVTIGTPIANMQAHILDGKKRPVPVNLPGELHLSGAGVARGYLNDPEQTAARFLAHPADSRQRLYATGDRARLRPDGTVEYLGRLDRQLQLRGYRIEPEEIELALQRHPSIGAAVVTGLADDDAGLAAYLVPAVAGETVPDAQIRAFLQEHLPRYMVPGLYVWLDALPLDDRGKCDHSRLPAPGHEPGSAAAVGPLTATQRTLLEVLGSVLGRPSIGLHDNYFELGGDSIRAIQIISRLYTSGLTLDIADLFGSSTMLELSARVRTADQSPSQDAVWGAVPLGPIQTWYLRHFEAGTQRYHQSMALFSEERLHANHLGTAFDALVAHHDQLRASFRLVPGTSQIEQHLALEVGPVEACVHDLTAASDPREAITADTAALQTSLRLEEAPLLRIRIYRCAQGDYLAIILHHLVVDGISWRIILEDLSTTYRQRLQDEPVSLPLKSRSFRDWTEHLHRRSTTHEVLGQEDYWHGLVHSGVERIPSDHEAPANTYADAVTMTAHLAPPHTEALLEGSHRTHRAGLDVVLLAAVSAALHTTWGLSSVLIMLEGHGRDRDGDSPDVSRTVGWFTSRYPFVLRHAGETPSDRVAAVQAALRSVPNGGLGYGLVDVITPPGLRRHAGFTPQAQLEFNYLGQVDADVPAGPFRLSRIPLGRGIDPAAVRPVELELNCVVVAGRLELALAYNRQQFREETLRRFLDACTAELTRLAGAAAIARPWAEEPAAAQEGGELARLLEAHPAWRGNIQGVTSLSPMQEGMLFHAVLEPGSSLHCDQMTMALTGDLSPELFRQAWALLLERHDALRTQFVHAGVPRPVQVTLARGDVDRCLVYRDLSGVEPARQAELFTQARHEDAQRGFELDADALVRIWLFRLGPSRHRLLISNHHIILDGWSAAALWRELVGVYQALAGSREPVLPPVSPYAAYVDWLARRTGNEQRDYWKALLCGYGRPAGLPFRRSPPCGEVARVHAELDASLTARLMRLSNEMQVTAFTIVQAIWGIVLGKYNEVDDVVFGVVVSIRPPELEGIEHSLGLYVNTIPVRLRAFSDGTFEELIAGVQTRALQGWHHQHFPLAEILKATPLREKLFDHLLIFENYPVADPGAPGAQARAFDVSDVELTERTAYDLVVEVNPGSRLRFTLGYDPAVYARVDLQALLEHVLQLTSDILAGAPGRRIRELSLIGAEQAAALRSRIAAEQTFFSQLGEVDFD